MKNLPIISVVITAYNVEKYIGRCLRSAINQTFPRQNYEIIVVDDSSKDRTKYGLELFKDEVRVIQHSERLAEALIIAKRPAHGISPLHIDEVIGMRVISDLPVDHILQWEDLAREKP